MFHLRNISDMNDLCNAQDVILLCEVIENVFQLSKINTVLAQENAILQVP